MPLKENEGECRGAFGDADNNHSRMYIFGVKPTPLLKLVAVLEMTGSAGRRTGMITPLSRTWVPSPQMFSLHCTVSHWALTQGNQPVPRNEDGTERDKTQVKTFVKMMEVD